MSQAVSDGTPWATEKDQVLRGLCVRADQGLTEKEAQARLERFGPNVLTDFQATSWLTILWRQLRGFIMFLLAAGAGLSFALGDHLEGVAIVAVIVINTMIGFATELRAVRSTEALRELGSTETTVRRGGVVRRLPAQRLVPGDVVMVTGDQGPTAEHIAASVKLIDEGDKGHAVTGMALQALLEGGEAAKEKLRSTHVFARTDPEQKLQLLSFFQGQGEIVAMIGDGVNDAPALRQSDIGVAMGRRGTQVAREAADIVVVPQNAVRREM